MTYEYTREIVEGGYNLDANPLRVDGDGNQIYLADEIGVALPGKIFKILCDDNTCHIIFDDTLTPLEKDTFDLVVADHKNNT